MRIAWKRPKIYDEAKEMNIIGCMDTADNGEYFLSGEAVLQLFKELHIIDGKLFA